MTTKEVIQKQLEQSYSAIFNARKSQMTIRNWCITLVFALITAISTDKLVLNDNQKIWLVMIPIILFWILESMQQSIVKIDQYKARKLEKLLIEDKEMNEIETDLFYVTSSSIISFKQKIKYLIRSMILTETLIGFYVLLVAGILTILYLLN